MAEERHIAASHEMPWFITSPADTDGLMGFAAIMLVGMVLLAGVAFFWLHSLPERMMHKSRKLQFDLVAVLCLLSLFTHVHAFWVAALVLAFVNVPDVVLPEFSGPLGRIASELEHRNRRGKADNADPLVSENPGQSVKAGK